MENFGLSDHQIIRFDLKLESKAQINNAMVPDFRKENCEGFVGNMNNLNWEYLFQGKNTYEMWDIFKSLLDKFTRNLYQWKNTFLKRLHPSISSRNIV